VTIIDEVSTLRKERCVFYAMINY